MRQSLHRRRLMLAAAALPLLTRPAAARAAPMSRVRPGDPGWPGAAEWDRLSAAVGGRMIQPQSPLAVCRDDPAGGACQGVFKELKNPYAIGDNPSLTQTCGWIDAWSAQPSTYVVAAESAADVAAAVNFAQKHNVRLVVRGGGHSYLGTSNAADSLMVWTRHMHAITVHDRFVAAGGSEGYPAVSVGAGAIWGHVYNAVTTRHGRYVQGGGCLTVGVAGLLQGGGFGSYSKQFGTGGANLLEAEVVTADGAIRVANPHSNPDLFWALKGGGGGTFGVVTRVTLRAHDLPARCGYVNATIHAASEAAFQRLIGMFVDVCADRLVDRHWGEIVTLRPGNRMDIRVAYQDLHQADAEAIWHPFFQGVASAPQDFSFAFPPRIISAPMRLRWDPSAYRLYAPGAIRTDDRPGASPENIFWVSNVSEAGHYLYGFESLWLPQALLRRGARAHLTEALAAAARTWSVELHLQKGLAGAPPQTVAAVRDTPMNPAVLDAFALAIIAGEGPPAFPGLPGHEPDMPVARRGAVLIRKAADTLRALAPHAGAYVAESSFFETDWQHSYWGPHYDRLLAIKRRYDPTGVFFARHGVGSEDWSDDGFTRRA